MNRIILLTLPAIFAVTGLLAQEITKKEAIKFKIKSFARIDYDGKIKSIDYFDDLGELIKVGREENGAILIQKEFIYDQTGRLSLLKNFSTDGGIHHIDKYFYNSKNQLISKESHNSEDHISATWNYEFDENGNKIKEIRQSGTTGHSATSFKYLNGKLAEEETTNGTIGKENKIVYQYNSRGQITLQKTIDYFSNTIIVLTYSYGRNGLLTELEEKSSNGVSAITTYEYDSKGLLLSDTWESSLTATSQKTTYKVGY